MGFKHELEPASTREDTAGPAPRDGGDDERSHELLSAALIGKDSLANAALDGLERVLGGLGGIDRPGQLARLQVAADEHGAAATATAAASVRSADAAVAGGVRPAAAAPDRGHLREQILAAGERELGEVDAAFEKEKAELERRLGGALGTVIAEEKTQTGKLETQIAAGDAQAAKDIAGRSAAHDRQIAGESAKLDGEAADAKVPLAIQAARDADALRQAAAAQARQTREEAQKRAEELRAEGRTQAARARAAGATKSNEALLAAAAAGKVPGEELGAVTVAGGMRSTQALAEADRDASAIEAHAEALAKTVIADGEKKAEAQIARGEAAAAEAKTRGESGATRVADQAALAGSFMKLEADAAAERMTAQRTGLGADASDRLAETARKMSSAEAGAKARADEDRAEALARMQKAHDEERKKVEARVQATLARVDRAAGGDLAKLERQVNADLAALDRESAAEERRLAAQAGRAEKRLERELAAVKGGIRAEARKAKVAIDRFVAAARRKILAADRATGADIAAAARSGRAALEAEDDKVTAEEGAAETTATETLERQAAADVTALDATATATATKAKGDLAREADAVAGKIDAGWVKDAVTAADHDLDDEGILNVVTDDEALHAMDLLVSLPASVQGRAIAGLGKEQFDNLLDEVPKARREDFEPLVKNTADPDRRLLLWREFYKAHGWNDAKRLAGDVGEGKRFWEWSAAERENRRRDERRRAAAGDAEGEANEEAKFLLDRAAKGTALTAHDVDSLVERKAIEHDMEMKYNVDLTNESGTRADGSKIVWTADELRAMEASFAQVPVEHMAGNKLLKELRREDVVVENGAPDPNIGGQHWNGVVTVFDGGAGLGATGYRHGGDARELASPYVCGRCGVKINVIDMVITHEIGHDMHDQKGDVFEKYQKVSGWEARDRGDLEDAGLTAAEIQKLEDTRAQNYAARKQIHKNGKIYMVDPYGKGYLAVDETAIPELGESEDGAAGTDHDTWEYARSNYKDQFAEHYAKAVHVPEKLYKDLVESPAQAVDYAKVGLDVNKMTLGLLDPTRNTPHDYEVARQAVAKSEKELAVAEKKRDQRKQQFDLMRNEVFGADKEVAAAQARLRARGISEAKIAAFSAEAAKVSTPEQVKLLEGRVT